MIRGKNILIFGLGKEGVSAANFLGRYNNISVVDKKPKEELEEFFGKVKVPVNFYQKDEFPKSKSFDLLIRSPGIRPDDELIIGQIKKGTAQSSVTRLFFDLCPAKIIGVTGTKGKGTCATLIHKMAQDAKQNVYLAGNIGTPRG